VVSDAQPLGVAAKMFEILSKENVNIEMISTSEIKISVLIDLAKGDASDASGSRGFFGLAGVLHFPASTTG
jgi:aspartate kinase